MTMIDGLLAELEQEAATTRRVLERIPQAHLSWKPHPKSMSLGQLALHVATVPGNVAELAAMDTIPEPPNFVQPKRPRRRSWCRRSPRASRRRSGRSADSTMRRWPRRGGCRAAARDIMAMPRVAFVRAIMLNHWYHHRGQLLVYLRLLDQSGAVGVRPDRRREPVRGVSDRRFGGEVCRGHAVRRQVVTHFSKTFEQGVM